MSTSLVDVSFDFFDPNPKINYHAIKRLLNQLFHPIRCVNSGLKAETFNVQPSSTVAKLFLLDLTSYRLRELYTGLTLRQPLRMWLHLEGQPNRYDGFHIPKAFRSSSLAMGDVALVDFSPGMLQLRHNQKAVCGALFGKRGSLGC